jgi:glycosyltransferase involved in cell wall biosynthesis
MRIAHVIPGSGGRFYCENCVRDNSLARALLQAGEDVLVVPMYLPPMEDSPAARADVPVFFGGINVYLQQKSGFFRKTPRWIDRLFDSRLLLDWAARRAGSVRASGLGETTLSMLRGTEGNQAKELRRLVDWMEKGERPDVVHLSNALLLGIGLEIKKRLGVPLVCSLQDEDDWIDAMEEPHRRLCWEALEEAGRGADAFVAVSRSYADVMRERMKIDPARLRVSYLGVDPGDFTPSALPGDPPAIGYLARAAESLGLGLLVEAFLKLKESGRFGNLRLHIAGGSTADDAPFLEGLGRALEARGVSGDVQFFEGLDLESRREFLKSVTVLSVPVPSGSAFGLYLLESLASGVPVVEPNAGSYPEILEATGGGVLYDPGDPAALPKALGDLLSDRRRLETLGRQGREAVERRFNLGTLAREMREVYRGVVKTP